MFKQNKQVQCELMLDKPAKIKVVEVVKEVPETKAATAERPVQTDFLNMQYVDDYNTLVDLMVDLQDRQSEQLKNLLQLCDDNFIPVPSFDQNDPYFVDLIEKCEELYNFEKPMLDNDEKCVSHVIKPFIMHLFERNEHTRTKKETQTIAIQTEEPQYGHTEQTDEEVEVKTNDDTYRSQYLVIQ